MQGDERGRLVAHLTKEGESGGRHFDLSVEELVRKKQSHWQESLKRTESVALTGNTALQLRGNGDCLRQRPCLCTVS